MEPSGAGVWTGWWSECFKRSAGLWGLGFRVWRTVGIQCLEELVAAASDMF